MFGAVLRIATAYVNLCNAGCSKYTKWRKEFYCHLDDGQQKFRATVENIEAICNEMEDELCVWKKDLHKKRWQFSHLNLYTVRQLMFLQNELYPVLSTGSMLNAVRQLSSQVFTLLEAIYPEISVAIFKDVVSKSSHIRHYGNSDSEDKNWEKVAKDEDKFCQVSRGTLLEFICKLEEDELDEDVAKAATMQCGVEDGPTAFAWAFENGEDVEQVKELCLKMDEILLRKEKDGDQR